MKKVGLEIIEVIARSGIVIGYTIEKAVCRIKDNINKHPLSSYVVVYSVFLSILLSLTLWMVFLLLPRSAYVDATLTSFETIELTHTGTNWNVPDRLELHPDYPMKLKVKSKGKDGLVVHTKDCNYDMDEISILANPNSAYYHDWSIGIATNTNDDNQLNSLIVDEYRDYLNISKKEDSISIYDGTDSPDYYQLIVNSAISGVVSFIPTDCRMSFSSDEAGKEVITDTLSIESNDPIEITAKMRAPYERESLGCDIVIPKPKNKDKILTINNEVIREATVIGTGKLYYNYSNEEISRDLRNYRIDLIPTYGVDDYLLPQTDINLSCSSNSELIEIGGWAEEVLLSNNSLSPTFIGWIKDNVYLLPSLILTIFGGAITLAVNKKKSLSTSKASQYNSSDDGSDDSVHFLHSENEDKSFTTECKICKREFLVFASSCPFCGYPTYDIGQLKEQKRDERKRIYFHVRHVFYLLVLFVYAFVIMFPCFKYHAFPVRRLVITALLLSGIACFLFRETLNKSIL